MILIFLIFLIYLNIKIIIKMNLLNKKIKDKIKLLDDIDKQYIPQVQSQPKKNFNRMQNKT